MEDFFSPKQIASRLSLDRKTIYRAIDRGELRAHRFGNAIRVSSNDLENWINRSVVL